MAESKPPLLTRFFYPILLFLLIFLMAARMPVDTDLWWHLAAGEQTLQRGWPALADSFSYTRVGEAWVNHSWLGQVVLALVYRAGGWLGLGALTAVLASLSLLALYRRMQGPPLWRVSLLVLAGVASAPVWAPRPQLFSLALLAILIDLLHGYWSGERKQLFWLPVIFLAWSNLHGGYALGFILLGCSLAGDVIDGLLGRIPGWQRRCLALLGWTAAGALAVLANPNGLAMWRIPFQTVGVNVLQMAIPEWASPDFHQPNQQPFLAMLVLLLAALGLSGKSVGWRGLIGMVVFTVMALLARRNIAPWALVTAPVIAEAGWTAATRLVGSRLPLAESKQGVSARIRDALNAAILVALALACGLKLVSVTTAEAVDAQIAEVYPVQAAAWIRENQPAGRLFNEYAWGGYLIHELPEYPVFVDGRTDLFGDEVIGEWLQVMNAASGWQDVLDNWRVNLALVPPDAGLEEAWVGAGWTALYVDDVAVVWGR